MRRGSAIESASGAAREPKYCRGAQIHTNARRRLNAIWLRDVRIVLGPVRRITRRATSRIRALDRSFRKYSTKRVPGADRAMALDLDLVSLTDSVQLQADHIAAAAGRAALLLLSNTLAPPAAAATPSAWQLQRLLGGAAAVTISARVDTRRVPSACRDGAQCSASLRRTSSADNSSRGT